MSYEEERRRREKAGEAWFSRFRYSAGWFLGILQRKAEQQKAQEERAHRERTLQEIARTFVDSEIPLEDLPEEVREHVRQARYLQELRNAEGEEK